MLKKKKRPNDSLLVNGIDGRLFLYYGKQIINIKSVLSPKLEKELLNLRPHLINLTKLLTD